MPKYKNFCNLVKFLCREMSFMEIKTRDYAAADHHHDVPQAPTAFTRLSILVDTNISEIKR